MENEFQRRLAKADDMARKYFENGPDSVVCGGKTGIDAVQEYYHKVHDVVADPDSEEALKLWLHHSDFDFKTGLQMVEQKLKEESKPLPVSKVYYEKDIVGFSFYVLNKAIENFHGDNKSVLIKRREEYFAIADGKLKGYVSIKKAGCYIATSVFGSYDCPPVWTLRRYRDNGLSRNAMGQILIQVYYSLGPACVKWFGNMKLFNFFFRLMLTALVKKLRNKGYESTPYTDISA